jgi:hypothetical protein
MRVKEIIRILNESLANGKIKENDEVWAVFSHNSGNCVTKIRIEDLEFVPIEK